MKNINNKLRSKKGETFVEILIAILIVAFGCMLIASLYGASMKLNLEAKQNDDDYYGAINEMETMGENGKNITIKITGENQNGETEEINVTVQSYGNDEFTAYRK